MMIREVENPSLSDLIAWPWGDRVIKGQTFKREDLIGIKIVGSGKGAIAIVLKYLTEKKVISGKLAEILVADWIGYWVYNQIQPFMFPSKILSERTKAILVYHQYGYPQDMDRIMAFARDKKLIVIEDCAHALEGSYKGRALGTFGDFSIYSFSKWFFCFALGGVTSRFDDFYEYADRLIAKTPFGLTFVKDTAKFLSERAISSKFELFKKYANLFLKMSYALYGDSLKSSRLAVRLLMVKVDHEIEIRKKRYLYFRSKVDHLGICDHLEPNGITPYVIPIRCSEAKNGVILKALKEKSIMTGLYYFDINRNLLAPRFVQCIWIPCHGGIPDNTFYAMVETILKTV